ncbi:MAG: tRNA (guanine-N(1)-)-methyltransferase [Mycoplasmataceae bacterium]|nr:MAG: tRNA (guanine-N(1)-)-methyltransferase [Mycoplasmataceae bacterium]
MLNLIFITLFPSYFKEYFKISLANRAIKQKIINFQTYNIRDYSYNGKADDYPYGGGRGMLIKIEPLIKSLSVAKERYKDLYVILLSPQGKTFKQKDVERLINKKNIAFICGHYEGFDQRINHYIDEQISIGEFITMGGELPALIISESLIRAIPNFIHPESYKNDTFTDLNFDYDSYTRPRIFNGIEVPKILQEGNHKEIKKWREENSKNKSNNEKNDSNFEKKDIPKPDQWRLMVKK